MIESALDATGNRVGVTDKDSKYTSYMLDPEYQLKSETKWASKSATASREFQYAYAYDPNGNRIKLFDDGVQTTSTFGDNNEQLTFGATSLTYDHFGNTTAIGSDAFTWDFEGHMLTATHGSSVDTHEYNGDGARMRSKLNNASDWTNFIYDPLESGYPAILAEYTLISGTFTIKSVNTHGLGLISTNREGTKRYFHFDGLGSTWALTDGSEAIQDTYTWSAFGIQEASTGSSVNPFRYVGQPGYYDDGARGSQLGLNLLGLRYYSRSLGVFLTWDPIQDHLNMYRYVGGSPANSIGAWGERQAQAGLVALGPGGAVAAAVITIGARVWWLVRDDPIVIELPSPSTPPTSDSKPKQKRRPEPEPPPVDWDKIWRWYEKREEFCHNRAKKRGWGWRFCCIEWCNLASSRSRTGSVLPPGHAVGPNRHGGNAHLMEDWRAYYHKAIAQSSGLGLDVEEPLRTDAYQRAIAAGTQLDAYEFGFRLFSLYVNYKKKDRALSLLEDLDQLNIPRSHRLFHLTNTYLLELVGADDVVRERIVSDIQAFGELSPSEYMEYVKLRTLRLWVNIGTISEEQVVSLLDDISILPVYSPWLVKSIEEFAHRRGILPEMVEALRALQASVDIAGRTRYARKARAEIRELIMRLKALEQ